MATKTKVFHTFIPASSFFYQHYSTSRYCRQEVEVRLPGHDCGRSVQHLLYKLHQGCRVNTNEQQQARQEH